MNNLSTLHHTVTTLSAGIGWPETAIEAPGQSVGGVMEKVRMECIVMEYIHLTLEKIVLM